VLRTSHAVRLAAISGLVLRAAAAQPGYADGGYADAQACAACHRQIADTYARTGMARSFGTVATGAALPPIAGGTFRHDASEQCFSLLERDGKAYLKRHQLAFDGSAGNILERPVGYWIGSGNHARSYQSRTATGDLLELPVTWYAEDGGHWGMSPGYARPDHAGFSRKITYACMFCHNAYPEIETGPDGEYRSAVFPERCRRASIASAATGPERRTSRRWSGVGRRMRPATRS